MVASLVTAAPAVAQMPRAQHRSLGDRLPLAAGDRGEDVRVLQDFLNRAGQMTVVDGVFGATTKRAVQAFQRAQRLTANGTATAVVVKVLRDVTVQGSAVASISSLTGGASAPTEQQIQAVAPGVTASVGADGLAIAPAGAPAVVQAIIAAGNRIAKMPYIYGGGHGAWEDTGYDSGSVSYALHGAGLVSQPMTSGDFMTWGVAGPGTWVTIYANGGHMFMVVAGLRFDTSGQRGAGTRWQAEPRSGAGLTVRHPNGL